ncbi:hypothetical protein MTR_2g033385 [Medicago truncatula]|uniref:Uncharacterized protein n=1 Tax=Medicago truncatula TaxID=3880 RepID=A0A072V540_MEDTR|nr:hypothetical protein MTR_2g033385 [Medicago truncatula]
MRRLVGFPNGLDVDRSKAQKDLNGPDDVTRARVKEYVCTCKVTSVLCVVHGAPPRSSVARVLSQNFQVAAFKLRPSTEDLLLLYNL